MENDRPRPSTRPQGYAYPLSRTTRLEEASRRRSSDGRTRGRGFTLIELLVVITIVAVMVAILLPSLAEARYHAFLVRCYSQMRAQHLGLMMYTSDNFGRFPDHISGAPDRPFGYTGWGPDSPSTNMWPVLRENYVTADYLWCPIIASDANPKVPPFGRYQQRPREIQMHGKKTMTGGNCTPGDTHNWGYWETEGAWECYQSGGRIAIRIPYMWTANYFNLGQWRRYGKRGILYYNGEWEWPTEWDTSAHSENTLITHHASIDAHHANARVTDIYSHKGRFFSTYNAGTYATKDQPVMFGDGHIVLRGRQNMKHRVSTAGGHFYY